MDFPENIVDFLREPNYLVFGTNGKNGYPQMTIVWFEFKDGIFRISTVADRIKYKNVKRDPKVTILIYDRGNPYRYVQIRGDVAGITREGGHDFIDHLSSRYTGNAKYKADPERKEDRVIISIKPKSLYSVGFVT
ncbi:PPOX class F420-dependent oxidoreductase [Candidatus Woesebacteria bacterium]|nr:PPOX class F420-dependent oxidoreductase [Candidatus Woesebacteria bacterium]